MVPFWQRVEKTDTCWIWTGPVNAGGYGQVRSSSTTKKAHRLAYEELVGQIPEGLTLDHLCRVRRCVNPSHLEPVTIGENALRGVGPSAVNARRTHCKWGHPFDVENTTHDKRGHRRCIACNLRANRRLRAESLAMEVAACIR